jgi:aminoacyl tRNA synthase complex-interacting multifunctional protein 1
MVNAATTAMDLIDDFIAELEARLNLKPGEDPPSSLLLSSTDNKQPQQKQNKVAPSAARVKAEPPVAAVNNNNADQQPAICKLEFKVGVIVKVWVHPDADKLYCEEIDIGEASGPRLIASGLRPHFTEEQMLGQRLLVASNLKAKNLVGFKSHGMVLCAAQAKPGSAGGAEDGGEGENEIVEFVEPPADAVIGETVTFQGLPPPQPYSAAQVEKKKVWKEAASGMKTTEECFAAWNGHVFMTSAGPCKVKTIACGVMR